MATTTALIPLNYTTWTSLGSTPMVLSCMGAMVYALADVTPTGIPTGVGHTVPIGQGAGAVILAPTTATVVWGRTVDASGVASAIVSH